MCLLLNISVIYHDKIIRRKKI